MDISKFSVAELFSNNSGKTSATAFMGIFFGIVSGVAFIFGCFIKDPLIINSSTTVIMLSSGLILGKKIVDGKMPISEANDKLPIVDEPIEEPIDEPIEEKSEPKIDEPEEKKEEKK